MKLLSAEQMRALDRYVIDEMGIPGPALMEQAGVAVAAEVQRMLPAHPGTVLVLCGKGNNGGDGLVAARLLHEEGLPVRALQPFPADALSPDAHMMYLRAQESGVLLVPSLSDDQVADAGVVVDALLGTGVTGAVHGRLAQLIQRVNALRGGRGVLAVDLPSGVDADTGQVYGPAIQAEVTVTMALPKPCLVLHPGTALAGAWRAVDIGFPPEVLAAWPAVAEVTDPAEATAWAPVRPPSAHKRSVGFALIIAGSFGMTGAATMACMSAYRTGAGLVRLALPANLAPALNAALTEVVFRPQPYVAAGALGFRAVARLLAEAHEVQATLIGPGLSLQAVTQHAVRRLVPAWPGPLVVDADALTAMAGHDALWLQRTAPTIITPHPGEMSRLLGAGVAEIERDRLATAREAARRFQAITVYKGAPTVIAAPDGALFVNPTGNAGLAVAGTGDTLAGAITALLAQGVAPLHAAALATYLGGLAAERLARTVGIPGMTALDLIEELPYALAELMTSIAK